ncbi:MAG TPA: sigma 54-interacting transcriptional regulator [Thermoanaerobaculia bacterium]|nr:sigma 54-interacting transcriptional regulator [Thermoanaerobaculia bacterium]
MNSVEPRLVAVAGPLQGSVHFLEADEVTIGRDASNTLPIFDSSVSRRHSVLTRASGSYEISDLESTNGTFVNGLPAHRRMLEHGDQIEIGASRFLFLTRDGEIREGPEPGRFEVNDIRLNSTVRLSPAQALYLQPEIMKAAIGESPDRRIAQDLQVLLAASRDVALARSLGDLGARLADLALEAVPAGRAVVLVPGEDDEFAVVAQKARRKAIGPLRISRTVLAQVRREKAAILSNDLEDSQTLRTADSLVAARVRALAAVPVIASERLLGVLYLDSDEAEFRFDEANLQLLLGLANIAAGAFESVRHVERLESERERLQAEGQASSDMVGESAAIRRVFEFVARVARADATVLILGESGTGKELAAHAIHRRSPRSAAPFVAIHCAALAETVLESELFGHERGAFTGALTQKKGKIEVADGGTVFLDEIGELSPAAQVKLLRVLQEREIERVGGTRPIRVDIRVIAATNKNLEKEAAAGRFREDLYYRLSVVSLTMPALRERREDIPLLTNYFSARFGSKLRSRIPGISPEARTVLARYDWPGNVRELANAVERAVVLGTGDLIVPEDLPEALLEAGGSPAMRLATYHDVVNAAKREAILQATRESGGSYTEAARRLGVHPNYLHRLVKNLNLKEEIGK